jgi:hypothetical protein
MSPPSTPSTPRRRGPPPGNRNAFKHGRYSAHAPSLVASLQSEVASLRQAVRQAKDSPQASDLLLDQAHEYNNQVIEYAEEATRNFTPATAPIVQSLITSFMITSRLRKNLFKATQPERDLVYLSTEAYHLIMYDFYYYHGISRDADDFQFTFDQRNKMDSGSQPRRSRTSPRKPGSTPSAPELFREKLETLDAVPTFSVAGQNKSPWHPRVRRSARLSSFYDRNSVLAPELFREKLETLDPIQDFLTAEQWDILTPLIPPLDELTPRKASIPTTPRQMINGFLTKIAFSISWKNIPLPGSSVLACRRYLSRLHRSGRLATFYQALFRHLTTHTTLEHLVADGLYQLSGNPPLISLHPDHPVTWQSHTGLLFLQSAYRVLRRARREILLNRRKEFAPDPIPAGTFPPYYPDINYSWYPLAAWCDCLPDYLPLLTKPNPSDIPNWVIYGN